MSHTAITIISAALLTAFGIRVLTDKNSPAVFDSLGKAGQINLLAVQGITPKG